MVVCYTKFLKLARDDASFPQLRGHCKHVWPVFERVLGSLKSARVFLKHLEVIWDALVNRLHIY